MLFVGRRIIWRSTRGFQVGRLVEPLALQPLLRLALPVIVSVAVLAAIRPNARSKTRADPPRLQARGFHVTALPALEARLLLWFPELLLLLMMALMLMLLTNLAEHLCNGL